MSSAPAPLAVAPLPTPRSSFVGRRREIAAARALLLDEAVSLLTLTGPGGVGKTRLALAVAHKVADAFADGVVIVDLSPMRDAGLVLPAIAQALGVREAASRPLVEPVAAFLKPRQLLLVLDNCEQVLGASPDLAGLLAACPAVQVLATSRAPLHLRGEHEFQVAPLPLPAAGDASAADLVQVDAVALFLQRARSTNSAIVPTFEEARAIAEICRRLDGLPLAIELAAARTKLLSPNALLALLSQRLRLLTGGPRDAPARQRTLRDTIAWSHDLLSPDQQALFRRLAVFAGGFDLAAACAVIGDDRLAVLDGLSALADQSLLGRRAQPEKRSSRCALLETIREYALEQLAASGEEPASHQAHARHFLALAEEAEPHLIMPGQEPWLARLAVEHDNLRGALAWLEQTGDGEAMLRMAGALDRFWFVRGHIREGLGWQERALALGGDAPAALRAKAMGGAGRLAIGLVDHARAEALIQESLALWRGLGNPVQIATGLLRLGLTFSAQERYAEAAARTEEAFALLDELGETVVAAAPMASLALGNLGGQVTSLGDYTRAADYYAEALTRQRAMGYTWQMGNTLVGMGFLACRQGDLGEATSRYRESLDHARTHGDPWIAARALAGLAEVALAGGRAERAVRLLGAKAALDEFAGGYVHPREQADQERMVAATSAALGEEKFVAVWAAGRLLSLEQAIAEALAGVADPAVSSLATAALAPADPYGLSQREREVLRLLAKRYSDKEIAEALFVSPRTVMTHATNIFGKLGVANRREAAAVAARHGLI